MGKKRKSKFRNDEESDKGSWCNNKSLISMHAPTVWKEVLDIEWLTQVILIKIKY